MITFTYKLNDVFAPAYLILLVISLFELISGIHIDELEFFERAFSDETKEVFPIVGNLFALSVGAYLFSSYISLELYSKVEIKYPAKPSILLLRFAHIARILLIITLSAKLFTPSGMFNVFVLIFFTSLLFTLERFFVFQYTKIIKSCGHIPWEFAKKAPIPDIFIAIFCLVMALYIEIKEYLPDFMLQLLFSFMCFSVILCIACSFFRLAASREILMHSIAIVFAAPNVQSVTPTTKRGQQ